MKKSDIILQLRKQKLVSVIRGDSYEEGYQCAIACIKGNVKAIEVAFTNNQAVSIIEQLTNDYKNNQDVLIGAGTVLDAPSAKSAISAGAKYIVSPGFNLDTAILCNRYSIPYIPGCMTIQEIITAMESGCEVVKLFPGNAFSPSYVRSIKAPLPHTSIMVTGGVNIDNVNDWLEAGVDAIGIGGEFNNLASKGNFSEITALANSFYTKIN